MPVKQGMRLICSLEFDEETRFFPPERKPKENPRRLSDPNVNSRGSKKIRNQGQTGNSVAACRSDAAWPASDEVYNEPGTFAVSGEREGRRQRWRQRVQQQERNRAKKWRGGNRLQPGHSKSRGNISIGIKREAIARGW
jgi:hypothetical protein